MYIGIHAYVSMQDCIYVCMHIKVCIHAYENIMPAYLLWMYAWACIHMIACMMMQGHAYLVYVWAFTFDIDGPHSAVVQRRGNPWSG